MSPRAVVLSASAKTICARTGLCIADVRIGIQLIRGTKVGGFAAMLGT